MLCPLRPNNILWKLQIMNPYNLEHFFNCSLLFLSRILSRILEIPLPCFLFHKKIAQITLDLIELTKNISGLKVYILI